MYTGMNGLFREVEQFGERTLQAERESTNVLVVDDEQVMRDLLTDVLEEEGYRVTAVAAAEEALERVNNANDIEIIITDIKMKGMDGIELLRKVKEIDPKIDVIVMTGYASVQTAVESMKLGAIDYLTKPLNIDQIRVIVNKAVEHRQIRRRAEETIFYKRLSQLDSLTELFNHRHFQQLLDIEIARAERDSTPLSLVMIDVDNFKLFNDRNGHPIGDLALKKLSWLLLTNSRKCDFVARYGGEEFAIIAPNTPKDAARNLASRIRRVVEETEFEHEEVLPQGALTISLGVAEYPTDAKSKSELIQKADQALYQAKAEGKNRVCVYGEP